jgi:hypothetical protein
MSETLTLPPAIERTLAVYVRFAGRIATSPRTPTRRAEIERDHAKGKLVLAIHSAIQEPAPR